MNFGSKTEEADSHAIMDRALEEGINFFDTANVYGLEAGKGRTEQIVGSWFAQGGGRREKTVLATKVYGAMSDWPNDTFLSARNIVRACEALAAAAADRLHRPLPDAPRRPRTPWEEIWQACEILVAQGKVLYVGSSNFAGWHIAAANEAAARRQLPGLVSEQSLYNLLTRHVELEVLPAAQDYGLGIIPWSPLHGGLLGGVLEKTEGGRRSEQRNQERVEKHRPALEQYEALCGELGEQPADVGLAWLLHQPGRHRADRRPAHDGAARGRAARAGGDARRRRARPARRDLPGLQGRPYGVRLVKDPRPRQAAPRGPARPAPPSRSVGAGPRWLSSSRTSVTGQSGPR